MGLAPATRAASESLSRPMRPLTDPSQEYVRVLIDGSRSNMRRAQGL